MKTVQSKYNQEIGEIECAVDKLKLELRELKQMRAVETCPFLMGDMVINGKGQTGKVVAIVDEWFGEGGIATICLYKKDGTMGLRTEKAYSWNHWKRK